MSLSYVMKLDMDFVITSLLSMELRRNSLESSTPTSGSQTLVSKEERVADNGTRIQTEGIRVGVDPSIERT